jgi:RNA polymerase sigma-70 factor (ECF subfamily)
MSAQATAEFERLRPRLRAIAYRMLGSVAEAEDAVQETWLRWNAVQGSGIREPFAWLRTALTRLCIDALRARDARREDYVGPWLPEPLPDACAPAGDAAAVAELADDLSMAFLLLLERLAPEERAAFLLHDVFGTGYGEIAAALGRNEAAVRQVVTRARKRVEAERPRFRASRAEQEALAARFAAALAARDEASLLTLLAPAARLVSDGGGVVLAALRPILGPAKIARFFLGLLRDPAAAALRMESRWINGAPGFVLRRADGGVDSAATLEIREGRIAAIYTVRNPAKLGGVTRGAPATG